MKFSTPHPLNEVYMSKKYFKLEEVLKEKESILKPEEFDKYIPLFLKTDLSRPQIESFLFSLIYGNENDEDLIEKHNLQNQDFVKNYVNLFNKVKAECLESGISEIDMKSFLHSQINESLLFAFL